MKISELIDKWEPGDWPALKFILIAMAGDEETVDLSLPNPDEKD